MFDNLKKKYKTAHRNKHACCCNDVHSVQIGLGHRCGRTFVGFGDFEITSLNSAANSSAATIIRTTACK